MNMLIIMASAKSVKVLYMNIEQHFSRDFKMVKHLNKYNIKGRVVPATGLLNLIWILREVYLKSHSKF